MDFIHLFFLAGGGVALFSLPCLSIYPTRSEGERITKIYMLLAQKMTRQSLLGLPGQEGGRVGKGRERGAGGRRVFTE